MPKKLGVESAFAPPATSKNPKTKKNFFIMFLLKRKMGCGCRDVLSWDDRRANQGKRQASKKAVSDKLHKKRKPLMGFPFFVFRSNLNKKAVLVVVGTSGISPNTRPLNGV